MFQRPFPNLATVSAYFIASGATSLVAASNPQRAQVKVQGADAIWVGATQGVPSGAAGMPGLLLGSGVISPDLLTTGAVYAFSGAANGATVAIRVWESSM